MFYLKIKNTQILLFIIYLIFNINIFAQDKPLLKPFILTQNEKNWIKNNPIIKVGIDRDYAPYEWLEDDEFKGLVVEYLREIEKTIGIKFDFVKNKSWDEVINLAKDKKIDMITSITTTPERMTYLDFTKFYRKSPIIIVDNGEDGFLIELKNLNNKKIAIEKNYFMEELISQNYPNIQIVSVSSTKEALELVNLGKVDAYVGDSELANYIIKKNDFKNLRFSGQTEYFSTQGFAVLKDNQELLSILNKFVISLSQDEIQNEFTSWLNIEHEINIKTILTYVFFAILALLLIFYWIYILRNEISKRKIIEKELNKSKLLYKELIEDVNDVIWKVDKNFVFTYISPSDERFRGYNANEIIGKSIFEIFTDESTNLLKNKIKERIEAALKGEKLLPLIIELEHKCKDGSIIWGEVLSKQEVDLQGNVTGYHGITREITERKEVQDEIEQFAYTDALTKLANRRSLESKMNIIMLKSKISEKYCALVFLDLDNFKPLNDTHGHDVGDLLLIEVANRLKENVRKDDVVSRVGGDEFVVILDEFDMDKEKSKEDIFNVVEKIRIAISKPYKFNMKNKENKNVNIEHSCTASIGIYIFKSEEESSLNIFKYADSAMYEAKEAGRNTIKFYE